MYAYREQRYYEEERRLHVVPAKKRSAIVKKQLSKKAKKKKTNPILYLFRLIVTLSLFSAFMYFVFPTCFNNLIKQLVMATNIPMETKMPNGMATSVVQKQNKADLYKIANPTIGYLNNDLLIRLF